MSDDIRAYNYARLAAEGRLAGTSRSTPSASEAKKKEWTGNDACPCMDNLPCDRHDPPSPAVPSGAAAFSTLELDALEKRVASQRLPFTDGSEATEVIIKIEAFDRLLATAKAGLADREKMREAYDEWTPIARSELGRAGQLHLGPPGENRWVRLAYDLLAWTKARLDEGPTRSGLPHDSEKK